MRSEPVVQRSSAGRYSRFPLGRETENHRYVLFMRFASRRGLQSQDGNHSINKWIP